MSLVTSSATLNFLRLVGFSCEPARVSCISTLQWGSVIAAIESLVTMYATDRRTNGQTDGVPCIRRRKGGSLNNVVIKSSFFNTPDGSTKTTKKQCEENQTLECRNAEGVDINQSINQSIY